jgi:cysteine sulfinate desulfinase/cysteine desulfurase-like protein
VPASLLALGLAEDVAREVLRFSFSRRTTEDDVHRAVEALVAVEAELEAVRA